MSGTYRRRVAALEQHFANRNKEHGNLFNLDDDSVSADCVRVPSRYLCGVFTGVIRDGDGLRVRIERPVTLDRDIDGSWLFYSHEDAKPLADNSVRVEDDTACYVLDALFELLADPDDVDPFTIHGPVND